jgi:disulfide oxidoreductase YuzD
MSVLLTTFAIANAQKAEFLYFKADLACCKAKSCNALEGDLKALIEKNYPNGEVIFKTIKISDEANKDIVAK